MNLPVKQSVRNRLDGEKIRSGRQLTVELFCFSKKTQSNKTKKPEDFETAGTLGIRVCPCTAIESLSPLQLAGLDPIPSVGRMWVKRLQFARRTGHSTLTVRLSYDLTY